MKLQAFKTKGVRRPIANGRGRWCGALLALMCCAQRRKAPDLMAVVNHYDQFFGLNFTAAEKADLVEFLKSL
jgi:hypothetical protein